MSELQVEVRIPRAFQSLFRKCRYKVRYGGRGSAKSWNFARALLILGTMMPLRILCTREVQQSLKDSVHQLLRDQIQLLGLGEFYLVTQTSIRGKNGTEFLFAGLSTETAESIKSFEGVDIAWVEEANAVSEYSWKILIPTIRKAGSEIWVSFNPGLEHDPAYQRFVLFPPPGADVRYVTYRDNPYFSDEMRNELEHLKATDYQEYEHVWEGKLKTIADSAVYGPQLVKARKDGKFTNVPIENSVLINTFWDLGKRDSTAIWFHQEVGPQNRFIDYYEGRGQDLEHYIRMLKGRLTTDECTRLGVDPADNARRERYLYGNFHLPHDVEASILGMPKTRRQQLEEANIKPIITVPRVADVSEGIEAVRRIFPGCFFDEVRCKDGINALSNYIWDWDEEKQTYSRVPVHNWASNGADAFRQFAQGYIPPKPEWRPLPKPPTTKVNPWT